MVRVVCSCLFLSLFGCVHAIGAQPELAGGPELRDRVEQLFAQGEILARAGDLTRAEQYLSTALQAGHDPQRTLPALLSVCVRASRLRSALIYATPYLMAHPGEVRLRQLVASILLALGELTAAERELRAVIEREPGLPQVEFLLGTLLRSSGREQEAQAHFARYLTLAPDGPHAEEARGFLPVGASGGSS